MKRAAEVTSIRFAVRAPAPPRAGARQRLSLLAWSCLTAPLDAARAGFALASRLTLPLVTSPAAARQLRALRAGEPAVVSGAPVVRLRMRALGGEAVYVRPATSDAQVVWETFLGRYHLPPPAVMREDVTSIWDLGCNVGLTMAHFAVLFPRARIRGVELDHSNAALARENVRPWSERCEVVEGAVWPEDGEVQYECDPGQEYGARVIDPPGAGRKLRPARARSLDGLMDGAAVDYVKMDIEGAEREVLRYNTAWATAVRCIKVEVHPPYTVPECVADLRVLGFDARVDHRHWACVTGLRGRSEGGG